MAANTGVTLAKIRSSSSVCFQSDTTTHSDEIEAVQKAYQKLGYLGKLSLSDVFDADTVAATRGFQSENGLSITGKVDKSTLAKIESALVPLYAGNSTTPSVLALRYGFDKAEVGCSGAGVSRIRTLLNQKGYSVAASGAFDSSLKTAVQNFQRACGLNADGVVGHQTFTILEDSNSSLSSWLSNGRVQLTAGLLARCGFYGVMLRSEYVAKLNSALNAFSINTKEKVKHFLAQCRYETFNGSMLVESGYQAGVGGSQWYSPFYGAGCIHLTTKANYEDFQDYMRSTRLVNDAKITSPDVYATMHVAINYPADCAGWYWTIHRGLNDNSQVNWNGTSSAICTELTKLISGVTTTASARLGYYNEISAVLK